MPLALAHRPSKKQPRRPAPTLLELRQSQVLSAQTKPLPTPPSSADSETTTFAASLARPASTFSAALPTPTPAFSTDRSSKMFPWIKKRSASSSGDVPRVSPAVAAATACVAPPKPILKAPARAQEGKSARFEGQRRSVSADTTLAAATPVAALARTPSLIITDFDDPSAVVRAPTPVLPAQMRRSSRPASPSASSFGARTRVQSEPIVSAVLPSTRLPEPAVQVIPESHLPPTPTSTPPPVVHVTTPPTAYVSSMQTRAPPPPSPYRPAVPIQRQALGKTFMPLPLSEMEAVAARPQRSSSLMLGGPTNSRPSKPYESPSAFADLDVPVFNIIPATPLEEAEVFPPRPGQAKRAVPKLEEAAELVDNVHHAGERKPELAELEFTPFSMPVKLPSSSSIFTLALEDRSSTPRPAVPLTPPEDASEHSAPAHSLPPSPPFESYPSLPSLSSPGQSHHSMPSIDSTMTDLTASDSHASLRSFADVEEALGSMLASLSQDGLQARTAVEYGDQDVVDLGTPTEQWQPPCKPRSPEIGLGYGLSVGNEDGAVGLGLGLVMEMPQIERITAPLAPRRRVPAPQPLDMARLAMHTRAMKASLPSSTSTSSTGSSSSLSSFDRHRKAFYTSTKPAPGTSPTHGIFPLHFPIPPSESTAGAIGLALGELDLPTIEVSDMDERESGRRGNRDSISVGSEASDDDVHSASIVCLTPVLTSAVGGARMEYREEVMLPSPEVGVAL